MHKNFVGTVLAFAASSRTSIRTGWDGPGVRRPGVLAPHRRDTPHAVEAGAHRPDGRGDHRRPPSTGDRALVLHASSSSPPPSSSSRRWPTRSRRRTSTTRSSSDSTGSERCTPCGASPPCSVTGSLLVQGSVVVPASARRDGGRWPPPASSARSGFGVLWVGIIVVLWRVDPRFGTLAIAVVLSRLVQSQFDLFWTAVQVSVPFVIAGVCLGAMAREERASPDRASEEAPGVWIHHWSAPLFR